MKLNKREQILFYVVIATAVFFVWYQFVFNPVSNKISAARMELESLRLKQSGATQISAVNKEFKLLPKNIQVEKLAVHASKSSDLNVLSVSTGTEADIIRVEILCKGGLQGLKNYLRSFSRLDLPVQVEEVNIETDISGLSIRTVLASYFDKTL